MTYSLIFVLLMCLMIMMMFLVCRDVSVVMAPPQRRRSFGPVSPKRIYRSLSVKLRGGASHDEAEHSDWRRRLSKGPADVTTAHTQTHIYRVNVLLFTCVCVCLVLMSVGRSGEWRHTRRAAPVIQRDRDGWRTDRQTSECRQWARPGAAGRGRSYP